MCVFSISLILVVDVKTQGVTRIISHAMLLCVGYLAFKLGTVDGLHLLAGLETEGMNLCVCLVFEVGQIALTSLLRRAAGIESSFKQPLPPSTVMRLSSIDAQRQLLPL